MVLPAAADSRPEPLSPHPDGPSEGAAGVTSSES